MEEKQNIQTIGRILSHTGRSFLQLLNKKLNHLDIERSFYALILIDLGQGELTQKELACQLESDKVSIVRIVDYLAGKGYVKRIKSSVDGRKYCLTLTDKAKEILPGIKKSMKEVTAVAYNGLTELQQTEFLSVLGIIKDNLSKANNTGS
jgi:MarR family transcriptional regulator, transcriptional regulator for hemolysin